MELERVFRLRHNIHADNIKARKRVPDTCTALATEQIKYFWFSQFVFSYPARRGILTVAL
jgi:hypothetical protein